MTATLIVTSKGWNTRSTRNLNSDIHRMEHQEYPKGAGCRVQGESHNHRSSVREQALEQ